MYHEELEDAKLHEELEPMDEQLAAAVQAAGCPYCGGKLHVSNYPRKPRGAPGLLPAGYARRRSFTCARCRRRQTPPSLRFLGRKVYVGVVVVVLSALLVGGPRALVEEVRQQQGVSTRTLKRWQKEWSPRFAASVW